MIEPLSPLPPRIEDCIKAQAPHLFPRSRRAELRNGRFRGRILGASPRAGPGTRARARQSPTLLRGPLGDVLVLDHFDEGYPVGPGLMRDERMNLRTLPAP